jgi:hypothetical protein
MERKPIFIAETPGQYPHAYGKELRDRLKAEFPEHQILVVHGFSDNWKFTLLGKRENENTCDADVNVNIEPVLKKQINRIKNQELKTVHLVKNPDTGIIYGCFDTFEKAEKFRNDCDNLIVYVIQVQ